VEQYNDSDCFFKKISHTVKSNSASAAVVGVAATSKSATNEAADPHSTGTKPYNTIQYNTRGRGIKCDGFSDAPLDNHGVLGGDRILIFTRESSYCFQRVLAIAILSVRLFVCLSVTRVDQSKTVQARITKFSLSAAWKTLVSATIKLFYKFEGSRPEQGAK